MSLPVSTSIHLTQDPTFQIGVDKQIERIVHSGFKYLDFNFLDLNATWDSPFVGENWEKYVELAGETAAKLGAGFNQAHAPVHDGIRAKGMDMTHIHIYQERAIRSCAKLGIPWMVYHPIFTGDADWKNINHTYFEPLLEISQKYGVGIAIENLLYRPKDEPPLWYIQNLIELADSFHDPLVGICWDVGHGNFVGKNIEKRPFTNQYENLTKIGKRLKALHIHDNFGFADDHNAPFEGTINWKDVMRALRDIGYEHSFTFEAHNAVRRIPSECPDLVDAKINYLHTLGEALVHLESL